MSRHLDGEARHSVNDEDDDETRKNRFSPLDRNRYIIHIYTNNKAGTQLTKTYIKIYVEHTLHADLRGSIHHEERGNRRNKNPSVQRNYVKKKKPDETSWYLCRDWPRRSRKKLSRGQDAIYYRSVRTCILYFFFLAPVDFLYVYTHTHTHGQGSAWRV